MITDKMRPSLVIDLDGTLLQTNTFRDYLAFCGRCAAHAFRIDLMLSVAFWVTIRKLRIISHSTMKRHLMQRTSLFMQHKSRMDDFVEEELLLTNPRVKTLVEKYRNRGHLLVLASAAPEFYAKDLADNFRLDTCLATPLPSEVVIGNWHENVGEEKLHNLQRFLRQYDASVDAIITDHEDDLPLLKAFSQATIYLANPTTQTEAVLNKEQIAYQKL